MQPDQEVIDRWSGAAPFWEKHREMIRQMFAPVSEALIEDARITGAQTVLDVATGPGEPALAIAAKVGPEGRVCGIDPVSAMVATARRAADQFSFANARFEVALADNLPFPPGTFDAAVSRFGVMFFPSPLGGVREMLRVLKPGGRLALAVWHFAESNPFLYILQQVVSKYLDSPAPDPDAPDTFRFATPGKLMSVFEDAGATDVSERVLQFTMEVPVSLEDFWTLRYEMSDKLRERFALLSPEQQNEAKAESLRAARPYSTSRGMSFPAQVLIVSGSAVSVLPSNFLPNRD